jgi:hypothetical protein
MNPTVIVGIITSSLAAIQALLPLLGTAGNTIAIVSTVITALTKIIPIIETLAPIVGDEVTLVIMGAKNIIASLRGTETDAEQDAALDALDARVDAAWDKIAPQFDPDYVSPGSSSPPSAA